MIFKGVGPTLSSHGLASHGLGLELKNLRLGITLKRLCFELAAHLIQKSEMTSAAELAKQGLIPGHGTINHGPILMLDQLQARYIPTIQTQNDRDKLTKATGSRFDFA